jgi:hypothetical protein
MDTYYISESYFTPSEINSFKDKFGYEIKQIKYSSSNGIIDFSIEAEKSFLLKYGYPKISARFFS